jgi:hypothetical protein
MIGMIDMIDMSSHQSKAKGCKLPPQLWIGQQTSIETLNSDSAYRRDIIKLVRFKPTNTHDSQQIGTAQDADPE